MRDRNALPKEDSGATKILSSIRDFINPVKDEPFTDISSSSQFDPVTGQTPDEAPVQPEKIPIETDVEEVMAVIAPHRKRKEPKPEPDPMPKTEPTPSNDAVRIKIFTAAVPGEVERKVNEYLEKVETDPRLANLRLISTDIASSGQGYSVMLTYKLLP